MMSNETKRDVFEDALRALEEFSEQGSSWEMAYDDLSTRYSAASDYTPPDDMPVIPQAVGDVIVKLKHKRFSLSGAMSYAAVVSLSPWMTSENEDTFARAWVLGVWRVEETGEIVKLEVED